MLWQGLLSNDECSVRLGQSSQLKALHARLLDHVTQTCAAADLLGRGMTIGLEQEFFLLDAKGHPADLELSQAFVREVAKRPGWRPYHGAPRQGELTTATHDFPDGRYTALKYEFAPHMLELAFAWFKDLVGLSDEVHRAVDALNVCASRLDASVAMLPFFEPLDRLLDSSNGDAASARSKADYSRARYQKLASGREDPVVVAFPSYMAGTQCHVGGLSWWKDQDVVRKLLALESVVAVYPSWLLTGDLSQGLAMLRRRWETYQKCFPGFPLLGIPDFETWSMDGWVTGLMASPLTGTERDSFAGLRLFDLESLPDLSIEELFARLRDFQSVRPRTIGTVEFRSDPAQPDAERMMAVAAMRFAMGLAASEHLEGRETGRKTHERWHRMTWNAEYDPQLLDETMRGLIVTLGRRGLGEERLLRWPL